MADLPPLDLLREAARHGPGYRGARARPEPEARDALRRQFALAGVQTPGYLEIDARWVDREAKLFEAGDYPDKGVSVSRSQIELLAHAFDLPVPVLIEHAQSPLQLGYLTRVEARGDALYGTLAFTEEAHRLIEQSGARKLSLGLSAELDAIREVSLVRNPRVADARLFTSDLGGFDFRQAYESLVDERRREEAERQVQSFIRQGRLIPAQREAAAALLACADAVAFHGETVPVAALFRRVIESARPHTLFERTPQPVPAEDADAALLLPEEAEFYRRYFPDVNLQSIAKVRAR